MVERKAAPKTANPSPSPNPHPKPVEVDSRAKIPDSERRRSVAEPYADLEMFAPKEYSGALMDL